MTMVVRIEAEDESGTVSVAKKGTFSAQIAGTRHRVAAHLLGEAAAQVVAAFASGSGISQEELASVMSSAFNSALNLASVPSVYGSGNHYGGVPHYGSYRMHGLVRRLPDETTRSATIPPDESNDEPMKG